MDEQFDRIDEYILGNPKGDYAPIFLEHALRPRNVGSRDCANGFAALAAHDGSVMEVWLQMENDIVQDASFWTEGCGSSIACGSMTTEMAKGKTLGQAFEIEPKDIDYALGGLPGDGCTCANLAVSALRAALRDYLAFKKEPWKRKYGRH
jgi:nitrogen fixation protein NifU and related proteins